MATVERTRASRRARVVAIAPVVAALSLLAGCGSDAGTATAPTTAPSVVASSTTTSTEDAR